ncbi:MAG: hypothetical protein HYY63_03035, partial [Elusimicrobia bacterium]|nr:hypothetical protein [Elusimicrobiota bacterium]
MGYKVKGIEGVFGANQAPENKKANQIVSSSLFGDVTLDPVLNILGAQVKIAGVTDTLTGGKEKKGDSIQEVNSLDMKSGVVEVTNLDPMLNGNYQLEGTQFKSRFGDIVFKDSAWESGAYKDLGSEHKQREFYYEKNGENIYMRQGYGENASVTVVYRSGSQMVKMVKSRAGISLDVKSGEGAGMTFARYGFGGNYDKLTSAQGGKSAGDTDYDKITGYSFSMLTKKDGQIGRQTVYHGQKDPSRDAIYTDTNVNGKQDSDEKATGYQDRKDESIIISTTKFTKDRIESDQGTLHKYSSTRSKSGSNWENQSYSAFTKTLGAGGYTKGVSSGIDKDGNKTITAIGYKSGNNVVRASVKVDGNNNVTEKSGDDNNEYTLTRSEDGNEATMSGNGVAFRFTRDGMSTNIGQDNAFNARLESLGGSVSLDGSDAEYEYSQSKAGFGGGGGVVSSLFGEINFSSVLSLIDFSKEENKALAGEIAAGLGLVKEEAVKEQPVKKVAEVETKFEILPQTEVAILPKTDAKAIVATLQNSPALQGVNLENVQVVALSDGIHVTVKDGNTTISGIVSNPAIAKNPDGSSKVTWDLKMDRSDTVGFGTHQEVTVTYDYDATGLLIAARGQGTFRSDDGFGNISTGVIQQTYQILKGQAKMTSTVTDTHGMNLDGSVSDQKMTVNYKYDENNLKLVSANGMGALTSNDGFGNISKGTITQTYDAALIQKFGRALLTKTVTVTDGYHDENGNVLPGNLDGSSNHQEMTVEYGYNEKGRLDSASGSGFTNSDDGFGNTSKGTITQTYDKKLIERFGKALLVETKTQTDNTRFEDTNMDGSSQIQEMVVTYGYDARGRMVSASGKGTVTTDDGFGNVSQGQITQTYFILKGQAKLLSSKTVSDAVNLDGSTSHQDMTTGYTYSTNGKLTASLGAGMSRSDDGFGNVTNSNIAQEFKIVNGQAKLAKSVTISKTVNLDGSKSWMGEEGKGQAMVLSYRYYGEEGFAPDRSQKKYLGSVA